MEAVDYENSLFISVIVPNYNHAAFLAQRIESVLHQSYPHFEVIILDDCSHDNSRNVIEQYRNNAKVSRVIYNDSNSGSVFVQWANGIGVAKGNWVWIAESDDWAEPTFLEKMVNTVQREKNIGLIYCNSRVTDSTGAPLYTYFGQDGANRQPEFTGDFVLPGKEFIKKHLLNANTIPNASAVLFKKELFEGIPEAYKSFKVNGDWMFWVELLQKTRVAYLGEPLNYFRTHSQNVRSATYMNGVFLPEIFRIQQHIADIVSLNSRERRQLKYNMLNRLFTEKLKQKVAVSRNMMLHCLGIISKVSPGVSIPALKTLIVLKFKN